jgi:hypothetical protein
MAEETASVCFLVSLADNGCLVDDPASSHKAILLREMICDTRLVPNVLGAKMIMTKLIPEGTS